MQLNQKSTIKKNSWNLFLMNIFITKYGLQKVSLTKTANRSLKEKEDINPQN